MDRDVDVECVQTNKTIPVRCYAIDPLSNDELMFSFYAALQCLFYDAMFIS